MMRLLAVVSLLACVFGCDDSGGPSPGVSGTASAAQAGHEHEGEAAAVGAGARAGKRGGAAKPRREVICDLKNVKRYVGPSGGIPSFDVSVSPSGAHVAVFRSVSFTMNNWMHRVEIDGVRGPTFRTISSGRWSDDGTTYAYVGQDFQGQIPGPHVVHDGKRHGPYEGLAALALSPDGKSWAALQRGKHNGAWTLVVDAQPRELATQNQPDPETLAYDAAAKSFVYKRAGNDVPERWLTVEGKEVPPPASALRSSLPFPPGVTVQVKRVGKAKDARQQLIVNGAVVGEFTAVIARGDSIIPAYPQPDGTMIVYVVEGNELVRLRL